MPPAARRTAPTLGWDQAPLAPVVLVRGAESVLADRAVAHVRELAKSEDPHLEVTQLEAAAYEPGLLELAASPSLFGERRLLVVAAVEAAPDVFLDEAIAYLPTAPDDVTLVLRHGGGQRGKKLLDAVAAAGFPVVACDPVKKDADKVAFVQDELRRAHRRADAAAVRALVDAVGADLQELVAACAQLVADTSGTVTVEVVRRYHGGRVEATGFAVADAAVAGDAARALGLLRHAMATGLEPVVLVAALASKLRTLAKVGATRGAGAAQDLGLPSWQVDKARRELGGWTPEGLAAAITAVAAADAEVKGEGRDKRYAVERAVLRITQAHR